jgi:hypothetical protein
MAWPSKGGLKLWRDACERLAIDADTLRALPGERDKYLLPVVTAPMPVRLGYIFFLDRTRTDGVVALQGPARLAALTKDTYKPNYLAGLGCVHSHFKISCQISAEVNMALLRSSGPVIDTADLLALNCRDTIAAVEVCGRDS